MLVRTDTGRYLREQDMEPEGREDQLYQWHPRTGLSKADRGSCALNGVEIALEGVFEVTLADGSTVTVQPVCQLLKEQIDAQYTPELQREVTGVHPEAVRMLARKMASKKTTIMHGMNACKIYHGDLIERAMCSVMPFSEIDVMCCIKCIMKCRECHAIQ